MQVFFANNTEFDHIYCMGIENLYGGHILSWLSGCLSAELHGIGTGKGQLIACLLKKTDLVDSVDLILPHLSRNKSICCLFG